MATIYDLKNNIETEKNKLTKAMENETILDIKINLEHNLKVCEKQLKVIELALQNVNRAEELQNEWKQTDDKEARQTINNELYNLQARQNEITTYIKDLEEEKMDIKASYKAFKGETF